MPLALSPEARNLLTEIQASVRKGAVPSPEALPLMNDIRLKLRERQTEDIMSSADDALLDLIVSRHKCAASPYQQKPTAPTDDPAMMAAVVAVGQQKDRERIAADQRVMSSLLASAVESGVEQSALVSELRESEAREATLSATLDRMQLQLVALRQCLESRDDELRRSRGREQDLERRLAELILRSPSSARTGFTSGAVAGSARPPPPSAQCAMLAHPESADEPAATRSRKDALLMRVQQLEMELGSEERAARPSAAGTGSSNWGDEDGAGSCEDDVAASSLGGSTSMTHFPHFATPHTLGRSPAHPLSAPPAEAPPAKADHTSVAQGLLLAEAVLAQELDSPRFAAPRVSEAAAYPLTPFMAPPSGSPREGGGPEVVGSALARAVPTLNGAGGGVRHSRPATAQCSSANGRHQARWASPSESFKSASARSQAAAGSLLEATESPIDRPASVERPQGMARIERAGFARQLASGADRVGSHAQQAAYEVQPYQHPAAPAREALPPPPSAQRSPPIPTLPYMGQAQGMSKRGPWMTRQ